MGSREMANNHSIPDTISLSQSALRRRWVRVPSTDAATIGVERTLGVDIDPNAAGLLISRTAIRSTFESVHLDSCDRDRAVWVVGNPPFKQALDHVEHALSLAFAMRANPTLPAGGVAMLLRLAFLEGEVRRRFWERYPVTDLHVMTRRPSFTGGKTDSCAYGFFVWRDGPREPVRWM